jgi:hypothetical protein
VPGRVDQSTVQVFDPTGFEVSPARMSLLGVNLESQCGEDIPDEVVNLRGTDDVVTIDGTP